MSFSPMAFGTHMSKKSSTRSLLLFLVKLFSLEVCLDSFTLIANTFFSSIFIKEFFGNI